MLLLLPLVELRCLYGASHYRKRHPECHSDHPKTFLDPLN